MKEKILSTIIAFTMIIAAMSAGFTEKTYAATGTGTISVDKSSVMVGDELTVNVNISSSSDIYFAEFNVKYDNSLFDFVSSSPAGTTTSPAGTIPYQIDTDLAKQAKSIPVTIKLKAKAVGTANFSIEGVTFMAFDGEDPSEIKMSYSTASVQVMAQGSDDATLSSINIAGASLDKAFAKWTLDYTCYVSYDTTAVNISATASQGGKVELGGPYNNLAVGNNAITIKSYAPNGKVMTYNINVVRAQAPAPEPEPTPAPETEPATEPETETETETEPVKNTTVTIDGKEYVISRTFPEKEMPDGYKAGTVDINGDTVGTAESDVTGLCLVYLTDADDNSVIYLYNKDSNEFEKYITFKSGKNIYVYLNASQAEDKPEGMTETECEIQGSKVKVYTQDTDSEFVYFYAVNSKGERIWYVYDTVEKTIQRKNSNSSQTGITDGALQDELDLLKQDNDKLTQSNDNLTKGRNITFIAGGVVIVALIVLIVVMAAHKSEEKHSVVIPDEGDYDYDNEEDDAQSEPDALLAAADESSGEEAAAEEQAATQEPEEVPEESLKEEPEEVPEESVEEEPEEVPEEPVEEEPEAVSEDDFDKVDEDVTQADMDAFDAEAQKLDVEPEPVITETEPEIAEPEPENTVNEREPAEPDSDNTGDVTDDDGPEIETEIIDLGDDIFDDDETAASKEKVKETKTTEEEPETIELEPVDGDDEEYFL